MKKLLSIVIILFLGFTTMIYAQSANDLLQRAREKNSNRDYNWAIINCDQSILLNPYFDIAYYDRGFMKLQLGRIFGAKADFDQAIALNPKFKEAYTNLGFAIEKLNEYSDLLAYGDAVADFDQAIALDPKFKEAYNNRGFAKIKL